MKLRSKLALVSGLAAFLAAPLTLQAQFTFITNNGAITITGYSIAAGLNAVIPASINGYPVVSVGDSAFYSSSITNASIPNSVTHIGVGAFEGCVALAGVTIGTNVLRIGGGAFGGCSNLGSVTIPDSVRDMATYTSEDGPKEGAFEHCSSLTNVIIGRGITDLDDGTFIGCTSLKAISIPANVARIGSVAFAGCTALTNVTIGSGVTNIPWLLVFYDAFGGCSQLSAITVDPSNAFYSSIEGVLFDKDQTTLLEFPHGLGGNYTIPSGISSVGSYAFFKCQNLASVTCPNSVTNIGGDAFSDCTALTNVTIGSGVAGIGDWAFSDCPQLRAITVDPSNAFYSSSVEGVLFDKYKTTLIAFPSGVAGSYSIPNSVSSIGPAAFRNCTGLTSVIIPTSIVNIGDVAFGGCSNLTSLVIPDTVITVGGAAFGQCANLTSVIIGGSVGSINEDTFAGCSSLTNINIPNSVTAIGTAAFAGCSNLTSVTIGRGVTNIANYAFNGCTGQRSVYFYGNAPAVGTSVLGGAAVVYHLPGTTGWSNTFAGVPTALWFLPQPLILSQGPGFGVRSNHFGFTISWATNAFVVVEGSTNLANPVWLPISTNTLVSGTSYFSDPQPAKLPSHFYRLRSE